jgi:hypothetical protein
VVNRFLALYEIFIAIGHFDRTKACPEHSRRVNPPKAVNEVEKSVFLMDSSAPQPDSSGHYARNDVLKPDFKNLVHGVNHLIANDPSSVAVALLLRRVEVKQSLSRGFQHDDSKENQQAQRSDLQA